MGLFGICSGDAFSWDRQSLLPPLLDLDPTYCQISSPLHISLSELEQVALNFTSLPHQATGAKVLAACATCAGGRRDMRWWPARHALVARRRDMRWWPVRHALVAGATCACGPTARHALAAGATCAGGLRDMRWWPDGATCGWRPARHALVAGTTSGRQLRWRCFKFDFTATRRQPARAGLDFDFWAS